MSTEMDQGTFTRMTRSKSSKNSDCPLQEGIVKDELIEDNEVKKVE